MRIDYEIGKYKGRWSVFCVPSCTWIFPTQKGRKAAERLAEKLNKNAV